MAENQDILLLANPIAGRGRGQSIAHRIQSRLEQEGHAPRTLHTSPCQLSIQEIQSPSAVIVIGGDGTLRAVAERLLDLCPAGQVPPLLHVPTGTANLMVRHLGASRLIHNPLLQASGIGPLLETIDPARRLEEVVAQAITRRKLIHLDLAKANEKLFLLMVGIGIDGQIIHELSRVRTGPIRKSSYVLPALRTLQNYDYPALSVQADGRTIFDHRPGLAFVGNIPEYGTGFALLPEARSDDGLLDVCVLPCQNVLQAAQLLLQTVTSHHPLTEGAVYVKARTVVIHAERPVAVQADGEPAGHTPVSIALRPERLGFIVP